MQILQLLGTKELISQLNSLEAELVKVLTDEANYRSQVSEYLASAGSDCGYVKRLLAELAPLAQGKNAEERAAWLTKQREENETLRHAIARQREIAFLMDDHRIKVEAVRRRYEAVRSLIALRTAQIQFLSSEQTEIS